MSWVKIYEDDDLIVDFDKNTSEYRFSLFEDYHFKDEYIIDNVDDVNKLPDEVIDKVAEKFCSIIPNDFLGRVSVVDEDGSVIATTDFTNEQENLAVWKAAGLQEEDFYKQ